jgi:hypothetical protein
MSTPEELAAQQATEAAAEAAKAAQSKSVLSGEDIPEAFRGKSAKEVIDSLLTTATELEKEKTERARISQEAETHRIELERIRGAGRQPTDEEAKTEREKKLWADPTTYLDRELEKRLEPLTKTYFEDQAVVQKALARKEFPNFDKLEKRIDEYLAKVPAQMRGQRQTIEGAWKLARLDDLDEREKEFNVRSGYHVEASGNVPVDKTKGKVSLDDDEKSVAKSYGMSDDDYAKWKTNLYGE